MAGFTHLHVHTEYSLLDGACRIDKLMKHVKELGQDSCAITDHGVMYGAVNFYKAAKKENIKPIIGCEIYVAPRSRHDRVYNIDSDLHHLVLLCKNDKGYRNLCKIVSKAFTEGFYIKPRADLELLEQYHEGLIALSACISGEIPKLILQNRLEDAKKTALCYKEIFGDFYLEVQDHGLSEEKSVLRHIYTLSKETGIPLVATNDAHYLSRKDSRIQDVMLCIQTNKTVDDTDRLKFTGDEFYLKSEEEMAAFFPSEAIENTVKIAEMCDFDFTFGKHYLPKFTIPQEETSSVEYLKKLCEKGFTQRYPNPPQAYRERLKLELDMIEKMGFTDYFLIVSDFIAFAKDRDIPVGPGRGSAAGSVVSYCLRITDIDPMKYNLLFERFLNPERVSMPDIDIDFCVNRRNEVLDYVVEKYGKEQVSQIASIGTMGAKAVVRDVARALGYSFAEGGAVSKEIPSVLHMTLDKALDISPVLKEMYNNDGKIKRLIDIAKELEGMPRHATTHAAGVVITASPVSDFVPLSKNDDSVVTQFTMNTLEELGLLKMDFLGLRNLTILDICEKLIKEKDESWAGIPEDDKATFEMLSQGKTSGVFQLESAGMTGVCIRLKPQSIEDITAVVALFRPGPMDSIPRFIESKHNQSLVTYKHPLLEPILSVTYGCIVYQEQVLEILRKLASFSLARADLVRRAMSKKKFDALVAEKAAFVEGCVNNGVSADIAESLFDEITDFANYAFNKSHAVAYAVVAYRTAYMKCHYPLEYMSALLSSMEGETGRIQEYISECREQGIPILPPDVNKSSAGFSVSGDAIRFGLLAVKNVGRALIDDLALERKENGEFTSFEDFCRRMSYKGMNKRALENLILCGALDGFNHKRSQLMRVFESVMDSYNSQNKKTLEGQYSLFGEEAQSIEYPDIEEFPLNERLEQEREIAGLFISGHPLDIYDIKSAIQIKRIKNDDETADIPDGAAVRIAGILSGIRTKTTKNNSLMAYAVLEDKTGDIELLIFSTTLSRCGSYIKNGYPVFVEGKVSTRDRKEPQILVDNISPLRQISPHSGKDPLQKLYIKLPSFSSPKAKRSLACLEMFPGGSKVTIVFEDNKKKLTGTCSLDPRLIDELSYVAGSGNVVLK